MKYDEMLKIEHIKTERQHPGVYAKKGEASRLAYKKRYPKKQGRLSGLVIIEIE